MTELPELLVDPERTPLHGSTRIYVRAKHPVDGWGPYDIAELTIDSLRAWMLGKGENYVITIVEMILGHGEP